MARKRMQKVFALLLALSMIAGAVSMTAFAADEDTVQPSTATLETLTAALEAAQSELSTAQSNLKQAQDAYDAAKANVSKAALDTAQANLDAAQAALAAVAEGSDTSSEKSAVAQAQAELTSAQEEYNAAVAALSEKAALDTASTALSEAQAKANTAQASLDDYNKALAQPVIDKINALFAKESSGGSAISKDHTTKTEAQLTAIGSARAAYDALTAAAQAFVTNYSDLTEIETLTSSLYSKTKWAMSSIPASITTSSGIKVSIDQKNDETVLSLNKNKVYVATLTVEIPADYSGNIDVDLMDAMNLVLADLTPMMPGQRVMFNVRFINHSAHNYAYADNSLTITDTNLDQAKNHYGPVSAVMEGLYSYSGKPICTYGSVYRICNSALKALGCKTLESLSDTNLSAALKVAGYSGGVADLGKYYIDYYNKVYSSHNTRLDQFTNTQLSNIYNANPFPSGITEYAQMITETNKEVAETGYDFFYNVCNTFGATKINSIAGLSYANVSTAATAGVTQEYGAAIGNGELDDVFDSFVLAAGKTEVSNYIYYTISGPLTNNFVACMNVGFEMGLKLKQTDTSYTVVGNYFTNGTKDNASPVALQSATAATVGGAISVSPLDAWAAYNGTAYTLDSSKSSLTGTAVLDAAQNVLTLNYYRTTSGGNDGGNDGGDDGGYTPPAVIPETPTPTAEIPETVTPTAEIPETPTAEIPEEETPKANAPKTGDSDLVFLSAACACASLAGLLYVTLSGRKKDEF